MLGSCWWPYAEEEEVAPTGLRSSLIEVRLLCTLASCMLFMAVADAWAHKGCAGRLARVGRGE